MRQTIGLLLITLLIANAGLSFAKENVAKAKILKSAEAVKKAKAQVLSQTHLETAKIDKSAAESKEDCPPTHAEKKLPEVITITPEYHAATEADNDQGTNDEAVIDKIAEKELLPKHGDNVDKLLKDADKTLDKVNGAGLKGQQLSKEDAAAEEIIAEQHKQGQKAETKETAQEAVSQAKEEVKQQAASQAAQQAQASQEQEAEKIEEKVEEKEEEKIDEKVEEKVAEAEGQQGAQTPAAQEEAAVKAEEKVEEAGQQAKEEVAEAPAEAAEEKAEQAKEEVDAAATEEKEKVDEKAEQAKEAVEEKAEQEKEAVDAKAEEKTEEAKL